MKETNKRIMRSRNDWQWCFCFDRNRIFGLIALDINSNKVFFLIKFNIIFDHISLSDIRYKLIKNESQLSGHNVLCRKAFCDKHTFQQTENSSRQLSNTISLSNFVQLPSGAIGNGYDYH